MIVKVTEKNFQKEVYDCHGAVLVEFYASWCPKCAMMEDVLKKFPKIILKSEYVRSIPGKKSVCQTSTE